MTVVDIQHYSVSSADFSVGEQGLLAAPSEGQGKTGPLSQGWLQGVNVGMQPGVPQAVLPSRVLHPRDCVPGQ